MASCLVCFMLWKKGTTHVDGLVWRKKVIFAGFAKRLVKLVLIEVKYVCVFAMWIKVFDYSFLCILPMPWSNQLIFIALHWSTPLLIKYEPILLLWWTVTTRAKGAQNIAEVVRVTVTFAELNNLVASGVPHILPMHHYFWIYEKVLHEF